MTLHSACSQEIKKSMRGIKLPSSDEAEKELVGKAIVVVFGGGFRGLGGHHSEGPARVFGRIFRFGSARRGRLAAARKDYIFTPDTQEVNQALNAMGNIFVAEDSWCRAAASSERSFAMNGRWDALYSKILSPESTHAKEQAMIEALGKFPQRVRVLLQFLLEDGVAKHGRDEITKAWLIERCPS
eukprot:Protomagalhaensia_wolfi_Nauph_80__76@NODE_1045_length_1774_cov_32_739481_g790_i0_p1_GENE_NODE_1045_length_1774_cov_32_739481_g790_i0NODE_1045_length_1774_cov_32_739481_g790_i0_p1_ORF_typecomplete_len185_score29_43_NODE_1045_length_1774_cov_32_739481_g790_i05661120